mmetsp:Transcript_31921/g.77600  ORF Transcript_31921/g.77600 Transcript_31921/m.77600 type:complete len:98 (+) Transcript_31921:2500-2793(+)
MSLRIGFGKQEYEEEEEDEARHVGKSLGDRECRCATCTEFSSGGKIILLLPNEPKTNRQNNSTDRCHMNRICYKENVEYTTYSKLYRTAGIKEGGYD